MDLETETTLDASSKAREREGGIPVQPGNKCIIYNDVIIRVATYDPGTSNPRGKVTNKQNQPM
jgi:hypothetical protein